jgi:hypothetical protein
MPIVSITNVSTGSVVGTFTALTVNASASQYLYVFTDTYVRLRRVGGAASDWIPVGTALSPRPMLVGRGVRGADFEVSPNTAASVDVKQIITDEPLNT